MKPNSTPDESISSWFAVIRSPGGEWQDLFNRFPNREIRFDIKDEIGDRIHWLTEEIIVISEVVRQATPVKNPTMRAGRSNSATSTRRLEAHNRRASNASKRELIEGWMVAFAPSLNEHWGMTMSGISLDAETHA
jgi:hypothetical protein